MNVLEILLMVVSVFLIILSLLQSGKSDGINGAFTGEGLNLFANVKERGPEKVISNLTLVAGITFFALVIIVSL